MVYYRAQTFLVLSYVVCTTRQELDFQDDKSLHLIVDHIGCLIWENTNAAALCASFMSIVVVGGLSTINMDLWAVHLAGPAIMGIMGWQKLHF